MKTSVAATKMAEEYPRHAMHAACGVCYGMAMMFDLLDDVVLLSTQPLRMLLLTAKDMCLDLAPDDPADSKATLAAE